MQSHYSSGFSILNRIPDYFIVFQAFLEKNMNVLFSV